MHRVGEGHLDVVTGGEFPHRRAGFDSFGHLTVRGLLRALERPTSPRRSPKVRLRESGDVQVATRSPTPARPAKFQAWLRARFPAG